MGLSYGIALERKGQSANVYWGKYPAKITNTQDPEERGRVKVTCPTVFGAGIESDWADPCFPPGFFYIPPADTYVWVEFYQGDPDRAIWVGCFFPETAPNLPLEGSEGTIGNMLLYTWGDGETIGEINAQDNKGSRKPLT
jgi:hypothetical protein